MHPKNQAARKRHAGRMPKLDDLSNLVTVLNANLDEAQRHADDLHQKAERLHTAVDEMKKNARRRHAAAKARKSKAK
jgi:septal ring factor EnvC (AmiA/AmiB activator)